MKVKYKKIDTQLNIFDIFSLFKDYDEVIFLDSGKDHDTLGKYSFIGINPYIKFRYKDGICNINNEKFKGDPFKEIDKIIKANKIEKNSEYPFLSGAIGYFSYDFCRDIEKIPNTAKEDVDIPSVYFNFYDNILIYDNINKTLVVTALGKLENKEKSIEKIENIILKGKIHSPLKIENLHYDLNSFQSNFTKENYIKTISKVKDYIESGHIYITNLTQRFTKATKEDPYCIYEKLRKINPAPFAAYMALENFYILSSSPERFLKIENNIIETRPIKGTRPRSNDKAEDERLKEELLNSEKDKSELLMIVDLERNDLNKVCKENSVKVTELFKLEKHSTVFHLVSTVVGQLKEDKTTMDVIKATFPGGSITGAPKIRSMEIIEELEKIRRNIYTGAIGYLSLDGNVDLNIVIRTILIKDNMAYLGVGGGITYESDEAMEYDETLDKALALMEVLK